MTAKGRQAVRAVALIDLAVTLPLAVPVLGEHWLALLLSGFGLLDPSGAFLPLSMAALVGCHLSGVLGTLWNGARAWRPEPWFAATDAAGRVLVAALLLYLLLGRNAPPALALFVVTELAGAMIAAAALRRAVRRPLPPTS